MTTPNFRAALERLVELEDAKGPAPAIANAWTDAITGARAALAEPVGEGPSRVEAVAVYSEVMAARECKTLGEMAEHFARAILARWGHPTPPAPELGKVVDLTEKLIAESKPMSPELAAVLTTEARWDLYEVSSTPTPPAPAPEPGEVAELVARLRNRNRWTQLTDAQVDRAATLLQQLSAPAPAVVPVAVSERLPGEGDCDTEGRCWLLHVDKIGLLEWHFLNRYPSLDSYSYYGYTHWLPHHAIPLPRAAEPEAQP